MLCDIVIGSLNWELVIGDIGGLALLNSSDWSVLIIGCWSLMVLAINHWWILVSGNPIRDVFEHEAVDYCCPYAAY